MAIGPRPSGVMTMAEIVGVLCTSHVPAIGADRNPVAGPKVAEKREVTVAMPRESCEAGFIQRSGALHEARPPRHRGA